MNSYNDYSFWRLDRDYCSDESGRSAEYKLGVQHHRSLEEAEGERDTEQRQSTKTNAKASHDEQDSLFDPK